MTSNVSEDRLLTAREAGRYLGFAEGTIRNKASRDELPHVKLGRTLRFRKSELDRWIIEQDAAAAANAA
jgi:excisionase family DNA binding protein